MTRAEISRARTRRASRARASPRPRFARQLEPDDQPDDERDEEQQEGRGRGDAHQADAPAGRPPPATPHAEADGGSGPARRAGRRTPRGRGTRGRSRRAGSRGRRGPGAARCRRHPPPPPGRRRAQPLQGVRGSGRDRRFVDVEEVDRELDRGRGIDHDGGRRRGGRGRRRRAGARRPGAGARETEGRHRVDPELLGRGEGRRRAAGHGRGEVERRPVGPRDPQAGGPGRDREAHEGARRHGRRRGPRGARPAPRPGC